MGQQSKSKAKRKTSAWYQRHANDPHVKRAQAEGLRSRAAFKLTEILDKHQLTVKRNAVIVDLGCAPGSWCMELAQRVGDDGLVVGVDLLEMQPVSRVSFIQGDFTEAKTLAVVKDAVGERRVDMVVSDMAPEMSGNKLVDQALTIGLNDETLSFAVNHLREGGNLLLKTFMGEGFDAFRREMNGWFAAVKIVKPAASRKTSSEIYLLGTGFRRPLPNQE
ncbi:MAG: 23S rRNA methyltransferase [Zetaproteobacteria bacterium CG06_land_8_20_14_3_00_59_53]|nr:MAG: 23S rRNA methyltransferase [Zetaproteobacteria bacterium CG2_30_59_37]PIO90889.1 MAG: 23S rRNA methyltransferase [Zetaproteobacteria bacterium CG23_combo_of_CG06-09_8_20_14_all_59_86]PIQ64141.1 MAG: 23S rRNA methyltransferase [Zetaproteobacteria bacterium CG11_big_fil_rev_8_21_14_0_20_59_439]PIU71070.1 MAG: 23S rRNA methyltransferase [Zetaproteobacteria bacterium CG06_land_8_20_14_3_00_59_53]PIU96064.1 MAG: 23S rRNA methyltransferase [Zetaproteobacteria bacterium CG03_land_8_20_14_0_80_